MVDNLFVRRGDTLEVRCQCSGDAIHFRCVRIIRDRREPPSAPNPSTPNPAPGSSVSPDAADPEPSGLQQATRHLESVRIDADVGPVDDDSVAVASLANGSETIPSANRQRTSPSSTSTSRDRPSSEPSNPDLGGTLTSGDPDEAEPSASLDVESSPLRRTSTERCHSISSSEPTRPPDTEESVDVSPAAVCPRPATVTVNRRRQFRLSGRELARLNDLHLHRAYAAALRAALSPPATRGRHVLALASDGVSLVGVQALRAGARSARVVQSCAARRRLLRHVADGNAVTLRCSRGEDFTARDDHRRRWDVIVCEPVDACGCLRQRCLEDIALARCSS